MSIPTSTDIVAGVASAADPVKAQAAAERLARIGLASASAAPDAGAASASPNRPLAASRSFEETLDSTLSAVSLTGGVKPGLAAAAAKAVNGKIGSVMGQTPSTLTTAQKFEAHVLQNFIELMLPKHADNVYGSGVAGENWKSIFADKLATEIARTGKVGVAAYLDKAKQTPSPAAPSQATGGASPLTSYLSVLPYTDDRN